MKQIREYTFGKPTMRLKSVVILPKVWHQTIFVQIVFWLLSIRNLDLPGLYFDEAGFDYIAVRAINPELNNPIWMFPNLGFPILGSLYNGSLIAYIDYIALSIVGVNIFTVRMTHLIYGSIAVLFLQLIIRRFTDSKKLSIAFSLIFATEISFMACFRDQFHLGLAGLPFVLGSIYISLSKKSNRYDVLLSGLLFGLSIWTYFHYLIFLPTLIGLIAIKARTLENKLKHFLHWTLGVLVGLIGYVIGYIGLFVSQGGIKPGIDWIKWALGIYKPLDHKVSLSEKFISGIVAFTESLNNVGNEIQIFGKSLPKDLWEMQLSLMTLFLFITLLTLIFSNSEHYSSNEKKSQLYVLILVIPVYVAIGGTIFGKQLTNHHYIVLIPFVPLLFSILSDSFIRSRVKFLGIRKLFVGVFIILMLVLNGFRFIDFHEELSINKGSGKSTIHINLMAQDALHAKKNSVYFFPDWGFWTSFQTLTGNRVQYEIDTNEVTIEKHLAQKRQLHICTWDLERAREFESLVEEKFPKTTIRWVSRENSDGSVAFYEMVVLP